MCLEVAAEDTKLTGSSGVQNNWGEHSCMVVLYTFFAVDFFLLNQLISFVAIFDVSVFTSC